MPGGSSEPLARPGVALGAPGLPVTAPAHHRSFRLTDGPRTALTAAYVRHHRELYRYCRLSLGNDADAQDALQSTFASALSSLRRQERPAPWRAWLFRIANQETIAILRARPARSPSRIEAEGPSMEETADERARVTQLIDDLLELPERERAALVMRELHGLSRAEIAIALGISSRAASRAVYEARRELHDIAAGRRMECEEVHLLISDRDGSSWRERRVRAHMRECTSCTEFADGIKRRRRQLHALAGPIPPTLVFRIVAHGLGASSSSAATGAAGKGAGGLAATLASKSLSAAAVATLAAGGVLAGAALPHRVGYARPEARPAGAMASHLHLTLPAAPSRPSRPAPRGPAAPKRGDVAAPSASIDLHGPEQPPTGTAGELAAAPAAQPAPEGGPREPQPAPQEPATHHPSQQPGPPAEERAPAGTAPSEGGARAPQAPEGARPPRGHRPESAGGGAGGVETTAPGPGEATSGGGHVPSGDGETPCAKGGCSGGTPPEPPRAVVARSGGKHAPEAVAPPEGEGGRAPEGL